MCNMYVIYCYYEVRWIVYSFYLLCGVNRTDLTQYQERYNAHVA